MKLQPLATNQTVLSLDNGIDVFFSYKTPVAAFIPGEGYIKTDYRWSKTTSKHVNAWAGKDAPEKPQAFFDSLV